MTYMSNKEFAEIAIVLSARLLKQEGFHKSGILFSRALPEITHLIGFQKSNTSSAYSIKITVNLATWLPALSKGKPNIWDAHWRERIGHLSPQQTDLWWVIDSPECAQRVGEEIANLIQRWGLPAINELTTQGSLIKLWSSGSSPGITDLMRRQYLSRLSMPK
jgi:hypothetical protein